MLSKIHETKTTLTDQVEERLLDYFVQQGYQPGSVIPNENELAEALGVSRSIIREALSRMKMINMIQTRPKVGMKLCEPSLLSGLRRSLNPLLLSEHTLDNLLGFRITLEIGMSTAIFQRITEEQIRQLELIVEIGGVSGYDRYTSINEYQFHSKLYEVTRNEMISEFQALIHPVIEFVKSREADIFEPIKKELAESGDIVTHKDLLSYIKSKDLAGYKVAIEKHFAPYQIYLQRKK